MKRSIRALCLVTGLLLISGCQKADKEDLKAVFDPVNNRSLANTAKLKELVIGHNSLATLVIAGQNPPPNIGGPPSKTLHALRLGRRPIATSVAYQDPPHADPHQQLPNRVATTSTGLSAQFDLPGVLSGHIEKTENHFTAVASTLQEAKEDRASSLEKILLGQQQTRDEFGDKFDEVNKRLDKLEAN